MELCARGGLHDEAFATARLGQLTNEVLGVIGINLEPLVDYGLQRIDGRDFGALDPLAKDTSWELRALLCAYTAHLLAEGQELTLNHRRFLAMTLLLGGALRQEYGEDGFTVHPFGGETDPNLLCQFVRENFAVNLSKSKVKRLIMALERAVTFGSVIFARQLAAQIGSARAGQAAQLFAQQCIYDDDNNRRPVLPCLGIGMLTLEVARACRIAIVTRIRLAETATAPSLGTVVVAFFAAVS